MEQLTLFQEGSLVSPTQAQENDSAKKMSAICGPKCSEQYARLPQVSSWAKMFAALLIGTGEWYSMRCKLIWSLRGTKSRPFLYLRRRSMPRTAVIEFGLLPTPMANDIHHAERVKALKETGAETMSSRKNGANRPNGLMDYLDFNQMLPTPNAMDWNTARSPESYAKAKEKHGAALQDTLRQRAGQGSQLNPRFVAEMMGFPANWTELPFLNGETNQSKPTEMP